MSDKNMHLMNELKFGVTPTVILCALGGGAIGLIASMWAMPDNVGVAASVTFVMAVMSGLMSMFI